MPGRPLSGALRRVQRCTGVHAAGRRWPALYAPVRAAWRSGAASRGRPLRGAQGPLRARRGAAAAGLCRPGLAPLCGRGWAAAGLAPGARLAPPCRCARPGQAMEDAGRAAAGCRRGAIRAHAAHTPCMHAYPGAGAPGRAEQVLRGRMLAGRMQRYWGACAASSSACGASARHAHAVPALDMRMLSIAASSAAPGRRPGRRCGLYSGRGLASPGRHRASSGALQTGHLASS